MMHRSDEDRLEEDLRRALSRQSPGNDFAVRLQTRLGQQARLAPMSRLWWRLPRLRWVAAAVLGVATFLGGAEYVQQQRQAEGEAAKQQVMVALRIAGTKIQLAQNKVQHLSQR